MLDKLASKEHRELAYESENIIAAGLDKYRRITMTLLENKIENLYGGIKEYGVSHDNEIWDRAIEECVKIVRSFI